MRNIPGLIGIVIIALLFGCGSHNRDVKCPDGNSVYFWRSVFSLSDAENEFLDANDVKTIYLHLFDVVKGPDGMPVPDNTLRFDLSSRPVRQIVPTVFIAESTLKDTAIDLSELAGNIIDRADDMLVKNGLSRPEEIQLDYDWTQSDRNAYFRLLTLAAERLHREGRRLSATIRLHQLAQTPPEVDYGVLMVYNIGNFADPEEKNSILSIENLKPYLRYLRGYPLPLVTALPLYDWNLLFHQDKFKVIARGIDVEDTVAFRKVDDSHYVALAYGAVPMSYGPKGGARIYPGDIVRREVSDVQTVDSALSLIRERRPSMTKRIVLYHLDPQYLDRANRIFQKRK